MEKEKLIGEYQADLKKVMDRIEEALANRKECMSTEGRKRLALLDVYKRQTLYIFSAAFALMALVAWICERRERRRARCKIRAMRKGERRKAA